MKKFGLTLLIGLMLSTACGPAAEPPIETEAVEALLLTATIPASASDQAASTVAALTPTARPTLDIQSVTVEVLVPTILPTSPVEVALTPNPFAQPPAGTEPWVELARQDLAKRLSLDVAQITFIEYQNVVWSDGSLGCPQPNMSYIQVLIDGYIIWLGAGTQVYEYHGGGNRDPFLCENLIQLLPPPGNP